MDRLEQGLVDLGYAGKRTTMVKHLLTIEKSCRLPALAVEHVRNKANLVRVPAIESRNIRFEA